VRRRRPRHRRCAGDAGWPRRLGQLLAWLPAEARVRSRQGLLAVEERAAPPLRDVDENIAHYLARGWTHPDGLAAWRLLGAGDRPLVELFEWLGTVSAAWDSAAALERWLRDGLGDEAVARCDAAAPAPLFAEAADAGMLWNRVLHYWGRGFLPAPRSGWRARSPAECWSTTWCASTEATPICRCVICVGCATRPCCRRRGRRSSPRRCVARCRGRSAHERARREASWAPDAGGAERSDCKDAGPRLARGAKMTERRPSTGGGLSAPKERPAGESVARLSDHLGRLLAHADRLLAEWQAHAESLRGRFESQGEAAGEALARVLEAALADAGQQASVQMARVLGANAEKLREDLERARQAAADLEAHMRRIAGGARPTSVDELRAGLQGIQQELRALTPGRSRIMPLVILANLLAAGALALVLLRPAPAAAPVPAPVVEAAAVPPRRCRCWSPTPRPSHRRHRPRRARLARRDADDVDQAGARVPDRALRCDAQAARVV
jgi:hypothetical protein